MFTNLSETLPAGAEKETVQESGGADIVFMRAIQTSPLEDGLIGEVDSNPLRC